MNTLIRTAGCSALLLLASTLGTGSAWAEKPEWAGNGKGRGNDKHQVEDRDHDRHGSPPGRKERGDERGRRDDDRRGSVDIRVTPGSYFNDGQRRYAHQWYGEQYRAGRCPPGLARKHNGCMPPGQARRWAVGRPLPSDVSYYAVPQSVVVQLGVPPAGYRYVRVANDIVLLAVGSRMVVDAITDLGRMF